MKTVTCNACGFSADISQWEPSLSMYADCRCPQCKSTNNEHNRDHAAAIRKAWNCTHPGELEDAGLTTNGQPLLKCAECGSIGLSESMKTRRKEAQ